METKKENLGQRIKEFRERNKLTQDKLAEMVGIDPKHLSRIENGKNYPSLETLEKLVDALKISFEDVFQFKHLKTKDKLLQITIDKISSLSYEKLKFIYKITNELY